MQEMSWLWWDFVSASNIRGVHQKSSWPRIEWFYIPASVGFGVLFLIQLKHMWKGVKSKTIYNDVKQGFVFSQWQVDVLKNYPTRTLSRCWGYLCNLYIPQLLRKPLFNSYSNFFNCNLNEALVSDVNKFETFNEFFMRKLEPNARYVHPTATLVSPADATVISYGTMSYSNLILDQIKGFTYPLDVFVGPRHPFMEGLQASFSDDTKDINVYSSGSCNSRSAQSEDFEIFHVSVYLAPGDYHWFHSPTEWTVEHRRHIPGHLFSVDPRVLRSINGIFNFNERVILSGHWQHGLFMYAAIGAYNVGSIRLDSKKEKDFRTNLRYTDHGFKDRLYDSGELYKRGDSLGGFELGSSLVLVFTAPKDFKFNISIGQKLKYGEQIGNVK